MEKVKIQGMSCQHCVAAVTKALTKIGGLREVKVDLEGGEASFENEGRFPARRSARQLRKRVSKRSCNSRPIFLLTRK